MWAKFQVLFLVLFFYPEVQSQNKLIRIEVLQGINKIFIGEKISHTPIGYSGAYGISFRYKVKKTAISFEPQVFLTNNSYFLRINETFKIKINQHHVCLMPMAGISISKRVTIK